MIYQVPKEYNNSAGIYCIENTISNKKYIGSTTALRKRFSKHFFELSKGIHPSKHMQSSYKKYGSSSFQFKVLEVIDESTPDFERILLNTENQYIRINKSNINKYGYNLRVSAESNYGIKHSKDAKTRIKGKKLSADTKKKMSISRQGEKHPSAQLSNKQVKEIKILLFKDYRNTHISSYLNISKSYINEIKNGKTWSNVYITKRDIESYDFNEINRTKSTRLTKTQVAQIKFLLSESYSNGVIGRYFETPKKKISEIKSGKTYKSIGFNSKSSIYEQIDWNRLKSLEIEIQEERKQTRKNSALRGSKNPSSILTEKDLRIIAEMIVSGLTNKEIAELFEVGNDAISKIRSGDNWAHVTSFQKKKLGKPIGEKHHNAKHSNETVLEIVNLTKAGLTTKEVCVKLGLEKTFVNRVKSGKTRSNITGIKGKEE